MLSNKRFLDLQCSRKVLTNVDIFFEISFPLLFTLELPLLPAHRARLLGRLRVEPLHDAVDVEAVGALTPDQRAVVT